VEGLRSDRGSRGTTITPVVGDLAEDELDVAAPERFIDSADDGEVGGGAVLGGAHGVPPSVNANPRSGSAARSSYETLPRGIPGCEPVTWRARHSSRSALHRHVARLMRVGVRVARSWSRLSWHRLFREPKRRLRSRSSSPARSISRTVFSRVLGRPRDQRVVSRARFELGPTLGQTRVPFYVDAWRVDGVFVWIQSLRDAQQSAAFCCEGSVSCPRTVPWLAPFRREVACAMSSADWYMGRRSS